MEHEHKTQGGVNRWNPNTRNKVMLIDEHLHKEKGDVNRCNTNSRHKVMLIDGTRTRDTR